MGKVWMPGGGGGTDLDVVTAGRPDVLTGKVIVDKDGEPLTGTMPNRGGVNPVLNAGESYSIPDGYHNGSGKVTANNLASQTSATATAAHILSGQTAWVNGSKVSGGIPWQNAEIGDRAWSQGYSNWAGTINLKVRNGHYLNGVNWIQQDIPEYQPWNIKKGVNIGGVVGTWEGYVPGATDLYYRGNNIYGWVANNFYNYIKFDSGQITFTTGRNEEPVILSKSFSTVGYSRLNVECYVSEPTTSLGTKVRLWCNGTQMGNISTTDNPVGSVVRSFDIVGYQLDAQFGIYFYNMGKMAVYRIWLS